MSEKTKMIHVRMPVSLIKALDERAEKSSRRISRSKFVIEAAGKSLQREQYLDAVKGLTGLLTAEEVPHLKDEKSVEAWLTDNRKADEKLSEEKWRVRPSQ